MESVTLSLIMSDSSENEKKAAPPLNKEESGLDTGEVGDLVNASGHVQELDRSFGFWSVASVGILADNAWGAGGGSLVISCVRHRYNQIPEL